MNTIIQSYISETFPELSRDPKLLEEIGQACTVRRFSRGEVIIDYGSYIKFVPLVVKGLIKIMRENEEGEEVLLYYLPEGNTCAASFSCCMIRKRSEIKAICEEDCTLIVIPLESADRWMGKFSSWRNFILEMYDQRLFAMIDTVDRLAFQKLDEKLWDYLEERASYTDTKVIEATHSSIANDLNVSRETISRLLKKLEEQEQIRLGRNRVELV